MCMQGKWAPEMRQNPGVQRCRWRVSMSRDIAHRTSCRLWTVPILQSGSLWLLRTRGCGGKCFVYEFGEEKSELGDELKLISLDPRSEDRVRISQMAEQRRDGGSSSADSDATTLLHSNPLEFRELFKLRIRQTPVSSLSFHQTDCFFLPDTPVYPAAAATCWFESTSSPHLLRWPLK